MCYSPLSRTPFITHTITLTGSVSDTEDTTSLRGESVDVEISMSMGNLSGDGRVYFNKRRDAVVLYVRPPYVD